MAMLVYRRIIQVPGFSRVLPGDLDFYMGFLAVRNCTEGGVEVQAHQHTAMTHAGGKDITILSRDHLVIYGIVDNYTQ